MSLNSNSAQERKQVAIDRVGTADLIAKNERYEKALRKLASLGNEKWKTRGHPMNKWVDKSLVNHIAREALQGKG